MGKAKRGFYSGRVKLGPSHPLVTKTRAFLLRLVAQCRAKKWTIAPASGDKGRVCYQDPIMGKFGAEVLLPEWQTGVQMARTALETHMREMRAPLKGWFTVTRLNKKTGDLENDDPASDAEGAQEDAGGE